MKRASFLKIVSVVMVVAMMLSTTIGVYADSISATQNPADTTININGTINDAQAYEDSVVVLIFHKDVTPAEQASLMSDLANGILDPANIGTKILGVSQATVDSEGNFECDITIDDAATNSADSGYTVAAVPPTAAPAATPITEDFKFVPTVDKIQILKNDIINQTNATTLKNNIDENVDVFAFDTNANWKAETALYHSAAAAALAVDNEIFKSLRANLASVELANVDKVSFAIKQEIYAQTLVDTIKDPTPLANIADMDQYAEVSTYENAYDKYCSDAAKNNVINSIADNANLSSFAQLLKQYKEQILLGAVVNPKDNNGANSRLALDDLATMTGLDAVSASKYNRSDATNRQIAADACKASGATTFADLNAAFIAAVATLPEPITGGGNLGGGGGGGGGGGSVTTVVQPTPAPEQKPIYERYNDINGYSWAWDAIDVLSNKAIIAGYENGSFAPANSILREEFIKLAVVGLLGADAIDASAVSSFADAQSGWYAPYIAAAEKSNITSGTGNGFFGTGEQITRQDMALMLYRMLRDASVNGPADAYAFTDAADIADYAAEAVYTLKNMGIINGDPDGSFRPNGQTTRAEAAVLLYKTLDRIGKIIR